MRRGLVVLAALTATLTAAGQSPFPSTEMHMAVSARKGKAFTAVAITKVTKYLANGTGATRSAEDRVARDSDGRWYWDRHFVSGTGRGMPSFPDIHDPIAQQFIHLVPVNRRAIVYPLTDREYSPRREGPSVHPLLQGEGVVRVEDLGEKQILGLAAWGRRTTITLAPGAAGNTKPLTVVDEFWYCDEFGFALLHSHSDPRSGEELTGFVEVDRREPDPALFRVPAGWEREVIVR